MTMWYMVSRSNLLVLFANQGANASGLVDFYPLK
jgi:hypothetical protein